MIGITKAVISSTAFAIAVAVTGSNIGEAVELEPADPASVGLLPQAIDNLAAEMHALVDNGKRAGVVSAVARRGKLVHFQAHGLRNVEKGLPMEKDTIFRLFSMTRAISAVGVLTLYEEGKYQFDEPVSKYIPEFAKTPVLVQRDKTRVVAQETPLNIYHLFTYTAGFGYPFSYPEELGMTFDIVLGVDDTLETGIRNLASYPLLDQPGSHWYYGFSSDVLGRVAEVVSAQPYDEFLKERVFDPLGMTDTGFFVGDDEWHRLAEAYRPDDHGSLRNSTSTLPEINSYKEGKSMFSGGGGLVGTVMDYLRFGQMLLNGGELDGVRVLRPETVELMCRNHLTDAQGLINWSDASWEDVNGYGWGLSIGVRMDEGPHAISGGKGEVQWDGLANTTFFIDPENEVVAVAMAQYVGPGQNDLELVLRRNLYGAFIQ